MKTGNHVLRRLCNGVFSFVLCAFIADTAPAQPYPNKPIRVIVASVPGGATDFIGRLVGQKLTEAWGQQMVFDNRGGAGGNIAFDLAAKSPSDGYTILVMSTSFVINPSLYRKLPFDPIKDFAPITQLTRQVYFIVVHPAVPAKNLKELIAFSKSKKGGVIYGSSGTGQAGHLGMELLKRLAGFDAVHVPYKGAGPAMTDLIAGQIEAYWASPSGVFHVKSGKMKALAVTGQQRSAILPDIPTVAESGYPGFEVTGFQGVLAPAGTPRAVMVKLHQEISRSLKLPEIADRLLAGGSEVLGSTPDEFKAYIQAEIVKWAKVVKQSGAKAD